MKKMVGIAVGVIVIGIAGVVCLNHYMQKDIIYSNVFINEVPVENMTKQEALNTVSQKERFQSVVFQFQDREFRYPVEELGFSFNYEDAVEQAYSIGKEGTFFDRIKSIFSLKVLQQKQNITLQYREDSSKLEEKASEINGKIYQQAQDATISVESNFEITPEVVGRKVELDKIEGLVKQNLKSNEDIVISLPVKEVIPKVKKEDLEHINGKLGQFSTRFNSSLTGRTENIRMATSTINSTILMPGEEFSFNKKTGNRGLSDGYREASIILNGKYEKGVAGGVCQVSTTLYNAALYSGLEITHRQNHSIPASYVDIGRDAAVVSGDFDLKFKNPYDYPVLLKGFVSGNYVTFQVYGDVSQAPKVVLSSKVVSSIPKKVIYRNDPTLPMGQEVVEEPGRPDIRSVTYMNVNGESKIINRDRYPGKTEVIRRGTKPVDSTDNPDATPGMLPSPTNERNGQSSIVG